MTLRHNRFFNTNAIDRILSRVEAVIRRLTPGAGNEVLSQLQEAIRQIHRFIQYYEDSEEIMFQDGIEAHCSILVSQI